MIADAVAASLDHLAPWMPWADETAGTEEFQRRRIAEEDPAAGFNYLILPPAEDEVIGGTGLHPRIGEGGLEIGYWLRPTATGRGVITAAVTALSRAALELPGITRVEIHCDEANTKSAAVAARVGFTLSEVVDDDIKAPSETGRSMIWVLEAGQTTQSGIAANV